MLKSLGLIVGFPLLVVVTGCGSPTRPTPAAAPAASSPTPASAAAPEVALTVTVDSVSSVDAIVGISEVTVDASASRGTELRYLVDFGDGSSTQTAVARHVYASDGTFTVAVTVTDGAGRIATRSRSVTVASLLGTFIHSGYHPRINDVEVRRLTFATQDGQTLRGVLAGPRVRDTPVVATVTPDRRLRVQLDGEPETLVGTLPSVLSRGDSAWQLTAQGGYANGETFSFTRRLDAPTGPPPDAVLKMRFFSFAAPYAIRGISPVQFDGSTSRGDGLSYYLEFGDGQAETSASAIHPMQETGVYTAQLTVVDRFGRSDVEATTFRVASLDPVCSCAWVAPDGGPTVARLKILEQAGTVIRGSFAASLTPGGISVSFDFSGTVSSNGDLRLTGGTGEVLTGVLESLERPVPDWGGKAKGAMSVTIHGGALDGVSVDLVFYDSFA